MDRTTTPSRALAITAGLAFTGGGLCILLGEQIATPGAWTISHALTVLTVFGTIAAGHLMGDARRARRYAACLGFLALFLAGTGLVVYSSVGRQADTSDTSTMAIEARNALIAAKASELATARTRFEDANRYADKEMTGERCGQRCKDWQLRATEVKAHVAQLEAEIAALGPQKPINPEAREMAKLLSLFSLDETKAVAVLTLVKPFLWTLFFEVGSIVSLGFAFRRQVQVRGANDNAPSEGDTRRTSFPPNGSADFPNDWPPKGPIDRPPNGSGSPRTVLKPKRADRKDEVLAALLTANALGQSFGSQREATERFDVPASTFSEWMKEWEAEGLIPKRRMIGRCKVMS